MKKESYYSTAIGAAFMLMIFTVASMNAYSQCNNTSAWGTATAPSGTNTVTITTCAFAGEYNTINNAQAGSTYLFTSSVGTDFLTVRQGTPGGTVLATGTGSVSATPTATGSIYLHVNTNSACGTQSACRTTTITCTSCVTLPPPSNDLCANATLITGDGVYPGTTINATFDNVGSCVTSNTGPGVWFYFTDESLIGSAMEINTCSGTNYDSKISVFKGSCNGLICVTGNDDDCGFQSRVFFTTDGSSTYYVLVHGFGTASGNFQLTVIGYPPLPPPVPVSNWALYLGILLIGVFSLLRFRRMI